MSTPKLKPSHLLSLCLAIGIGCTAPLASIRTTKPTTTDTGAWNRMHEIAAADLACAVDRLTTKTLSTRTTDAFISESFEISGCSKTEMFLIQEHQGPQSQYSMPWTIYSDRQLRQSLQFAVGTKCPTWTVSFIDDSTRGVDACGEKTVYQLGANGWVVATGAK